MDLSKAERLAALLDGKCSDREREELLAELAAGGEDLEVFADAAALLHEPEPAEVPAAVIPFRPPPQKPEARRTWKPPRPLLGLALAAGIAGIIAIPLLTRAGRANTPAAMVQELSNPNDGVPDTLDPAPWSFTRNAGDGTLSDPEKVQLGARLAELELRAASSDTAGAGAAAADIERLLREAAGAADLVTYYDSLSRHGIQLGTLDADITRRAMDQGDAYATFGAWLETARVAAARQDWAFFSWRRSRRVLAGRGLPQDLSQRERDELRQVHDLVEATPARWADVETKLTELLRDLAS
ncbi:MAG TPA: hypothetical protein VFS20_16000 [Longimicrobium sp.]|nr:hypothetical protein [Longimicrobium sp.]